MKSIVFFNNKGGVGKTTLACNLVGYLNTHKKVRVLLVDSDPQCNTTQALLSDTICEEIYLEPTHQYKTIYDYLSPLELGEPAISANVIPLLGSQNNYQTDLIPGHPKMSIIEDQLSDAWSKLRGRQIPGFRITNWATQLLKSLEGRYDLVVFDVGPSLGALNRTIILAADYIITPFGCDIFSLLGIKNISQWIKTWSKQYSQAVKDAIEETPQIFTDYPIVQDTTSKFRFVGYSVQQYVTRKFKAGLRPVKSYDKIMSQIPATVAEAMDFLKPPQLSVTNLELGHIPFVYSLVPMSQSSKTPIFSLTGSEGLAGSQYSQVKSYADLMLQISDKVLNNVSLT